MIDAFVETCTLSLDELRQRLSDERMSDASTPWMRYVLQEFPFVEMADGSFVMLRLQYMVQRMFGDLLYLKVYDIIKAADTGGADRFKNGMNSIFEYRVGQALRRIASHEVRFGDVDIIQEGQLKTAWQNRRGEHPKICDFVYLQDNFAVLIDANNRNIPKKFADRAAAGEDLQSEIQNMFAASKFEQLISTAREFIRRGWDRSSVHSHGPEPPPSVRCRTQCWHALKRVHRISSAAASSANDRRIQQCRNAPQYPDLARPLDSGRCCREP